MKEVAKVMQKGFDVSADGPAVVWSDISMQRALQEGQGCTGSCSASEIVSACMFTAESVVVDRVKEIIDEVCLDPKSQCPSGSLAHVSFDPRQALPKLEIPF